MKFILFLAIVLVSTLGAKSSDYDNYSVGKTTFFFDGMSSYGCAMLLVNNKKRGNTFNLNKVDNRLFYRKCVEDESLDAKPSSWGSCEEKDINKYVCNNKCKGICGKECEPHTIICSGEEVTILESIGYVSPNLNVLSLTGNKNLSKEYKLPDFSFFSSYSVCNNLIAYWPSIDSSGISSSYIYDLSSESILKKLTIGKDLIEQDTANFYKPIWNNDCSEVQFDDPILTKYSYKLKI